MKLKLISCTTLVALSFAHSGLAENLVDVYKQAIVNDQIFKEATATWYATRQNVPIANAGLLPTFSATGSFARTYNEDVPTIPTDTNPQGFGWTRIYSLNLSQPIFNLPAWRAVTGARATVKAGAATYAFAAQDLMRRTTVAYLAVARAYDKLRFTLANKQAVAEQLETARQQFAVGLIAITGVYDAQSSYDQAIAAEIADRNQLMARLEELHVITNHYYRRLRTVEDQVPLVAPVPNNIDRWSEAAGKQNFNIQAQYFTSVQAREYIRQISAVRYPTVNAYTSWQSTFVTPESPLGNTRFDEAQAGASLSWVPFQGGLITQQTKQAIYQYLSASAKLDFTHRDVINKTRQAFLSVVTGISQIKADKQVIVSARNAFDATRAGYDVGTRTMVDVLNALTTLYRAQQKYFDDQYLYLQAIVDLKINAGTLTASDLADISAWFRRVMDLPEIQKSYTPVIFKSAELKLPPTTVGGINVPALSNEPSRTDQGGIRLPPRPSLLRREVPKLTTPVAPESSSTPEPSVKPPPSPAPSPTTPPAAPTLPPAVPPATTLPATPAAPSNGSASPSTPDTSNIPLEKQLEERRKQILEQMKKYKQLLPDSSSELQPAPPTHAALDWVNTAQQQLIAKQTPGVSTGIFIAPRNTIKAVSPAPSSLAAKNNHFALSPPTQNQGWVNTAEKALLPPQVTKTLHAKVNVDHSWLKTADHALEIPEPAAVKVVSMPIQLPAPRVATELPEPQNSLPLPAEGS